MVEADEINNPSNYRNDLNIIQLNIRGLLNKQDQLRLIEHTKTDILLLCETWLTSTQRKFGKDRVT